MSLPADADDMAAALREHTAAIAALTREVAALRRDLHGDDVQESHGVHGDDVHDDRDLGADVAWRRLGLAEGERRHVTVLFADVSGFTTLAEQVDPEVCRLVMVDTMAALAEIVARHGGHIEKFIGDAVCAIFGAPVAHDDEPHRAVRAAVEMHRAMVERASSHPDLPPLEVHIGINTGLVIAGGVGDGTQFGVVGDTINTAARLMDKAANRQTFVSLETATRVRREFLLDDMGRHVLKGKQEPVPIFSVLRPLRDDERAEARVLRAPLAGRDRELAELVDVARHPAGQDAVVLVGDPGLGKTRLLDEADAALTEDGVTVLRATAQVLGAQPLELVHDALAPLDVDVLHHDEPEGVASDALLGAASGRPLAVLLDNVQHADAASLDLLDRLVEVTIDAPVVWVLASRPPAPALKSVRQVPLAPLTEDATSELVSHLLHGAVSDDEALVLARRAGGNPEFAEEIALALLDEGAVVQAGEGWRVTCDLASFPIPSTVHEMIEARIDALDTAAKVALQDAAVIGVRFSRALLGQVATLPTTVDAALAELVAAELVRAPAGDDPWYAFRNPTVREVAYGLLLHRRRPTAHRRVAEGLLELHPGEEAEMAEMLAHHFDAAGDHERAAQFRDLTITTGGTTA